ncbi:ATP-binding protein [Streptomyces sp. NPDC003362]
MWTSVGGPVFRPASGNRASDALVGRERETALLREYLAAHRLVTVTGTAGVGKSRLAAEVAASRRDRPWRRTVRVRWQGSGPGGPGALGAALARAVTGRRKIDPGTDVIALVRDLHAAPVLLFLDDVDPVHAECVGLVQRLLMAVPDLRVLVTARRVLGLGDERVLRLAPLSCEVPDDPGAPGPAVRLFVERARAAARGFHAGDEQLRAAAEVCRLVEGVPLAIELAAAQTPRLPVGELAGLLRRDQGWLSSPHPTLRRHRSLREAIGAGYVLYDRAVRIVWDRASVFVDSFAESTAVFLCAGAGVRADQVPACLAQLTAVGILEPVGGTGGALQPRYRMTRAAREFGAERLREAGELPVAAERHLAHCRRAAAVAENLWHGGSQRQAVQVARDEHAEIGAAVRYAVAHPEYAHGALEAVVGLWFWWAVYDSAEEGRRHITHLLPLCEPDSPVAVRALWLAAWLTAAADPLEARTLLGRAWPAAVLAGDDATLGRIAHVQGLLALHEHDAPAAAAHFQQAADGIPYGAPGGPSPAVSRAAAAVAQAAFAPGAARRSARRALADPDVRDDTWACLLARYAQAVVDQRDGHRGRAWHRARRALGGLPAGPPSPQVVAALRQLVADIESGAPAGHGRPVASAPPADGHRPLLTAGPATR